MFIFAKSILICS